MRVFQQFATLDLLSGGRAEIMAGRGSFIESFPLFGYDLDDYDELFAEKLDLLLGLARAERVTWSGRTGRRSTTAACTRARCRTRCRSGSPSAASPHRWCAPAHSASRSPWRSSAAMPERFAPLVRALSRRRREGRARPALPVSINTHGFVADDDDAAEDTYYPRLCRGDGPHRPRARLAADEARGFDARRRLRGHLLGSPEEVAEKILFQHEVFGHDRTLVQVASVPSRTVR